MAFGRSGDDLALHPPETVAWFYTRR